MTTDRRITIEERREAARKRKARQARRQKMFFGIGLGTGCLVLLVALAAGVAIIWTIIHFVMKWW